MRKLVGIAFWNKDTKTSSGLARTAIGGTLFGPAGAIVGAATRKHKEIVTFKLFYDNGTVDFIDCKVGSFLYNEYIKMMQELEKKGQNYTDIPVDTSVSSSQTTDDNQQSSENTTYNYESNKTYNGGRRENRIAIFWAKVLIVIFSIFAIAIIIGVPIILVSLSDSDSMSYSDELIKLGMVENYAVQYSKLSEKNDLPKIENLSRDEYVSGIYYAETQKEDIKIVFLPNDKISIYEQKHNFIIIEENIPNPYYIRLDSNLINILESQTKLQISKYLKYPGTAYFSSMRMNRSIGQENSFVVSGEVKAMNDLGFNVTTPYRVGYTINLDKESVNLFAIEYDYEELLNLTINFTIDPNNGEEKKKYQYAEKYYLSEKLFDYKKPGYLLIGCEVNGFFKSMEDIKYMIDNKQLFKNHDEIILKWEKIK